MKTFLLLSLIVFISGCVSTIKEIKEDPRYHRSKVYNEGYQEVFRKFIRKERECSRGISSKSHLYTDIKLGEFTLSSPQALFLLAEIKDVDGKTKVDVYSANGASNILVDNVFRWIEDENAECLESFKYDEKNKEQDTPM